MLDDHGSHRGKAVRQLMRSVGAKLFFLPKYWRKRNPIELAKLKRLLDKRPRQPLIQSALQSAKALDALAQMNAPTTSKTHAAESNAITLYRLRGPRKGLIPAEHEGRSRGAHLPRTAA
ncbi:hypothetical protein ABIC02_007874 [Bradyrhizobium sp. RT5a]